MTTREAVGGYTCCTARLFLGAFSALADKEKGAGGIRWILDWDWCMNAGRCVRDPLEGREPKNDINNSKAKVLVRTIFDATW